jgi:hydroxymethylpyrimidine/phosphomethylpyrimidine kinase
MQRVLIIAGSDCSGGAGIQADIKTVTCLSGYAMTAVTAVTVQNTLGVSDVFPVPPEVIKAQALACLSDIGADVIKTGMLGDRAVMQAVADVLGASDAYRVIDPVMVAKGGHALLPLEAVESLKSILIPMADLLTPNAPEAAYLTGLDLESVDDMPRVAHALMEMGAKNVLIKGGHLVGEMVVDRLFTPDGDYEFESARIPTKDTHGTGCTLASACAALMRPDRSLVDTVAMARDYVMAAIVMAPALGQGHGPLRHNWML